MDIRPLRTEDLPAVLDLTIDVFRPFYEDSFRPVVGDPVFMNRHGDWKEDYRRHLSAVHDPEHGRFAAVARVDEQVAGYIGWITQDAERHGEVDILAVAARHRRLGVGQALVEHAVTHMRAAGMAVVSIGTGGDDFHSPARALYESLGFTPFPNVNYTKAL
ncbi:GNAT family N-acetyltransferase [Saccharothrix lopnurensis]|uniref:GNAT family N-acetyltransferase n=1 Tax=Saccharothrix lopnurensis TaxID=1670621 RepID=A0ABW1P943_9PSEU